MNKSIETQAKTIEAAIEEALAQLKASYDEVDVDIIQEAGLFKKAKVKVTLKAAEAPAPVVTKTEPAKQQPAPEPKAQTKPVAEFKKQPVQEKQSPKKDEKQKPEAKEKPAPKEPLPEGQLPTKFQTTLDFTKKLLELLENPAEVTHEITEKSFNININGNGVGQIIGKGGEVMNAIQTIISSIAIKNSEGENKRVYFNVEDYKERREETLKALALRKAEKVKETGRYIKLDPMNARDRAIIHSTIQGMEGIRTYSTGKDPHRCLCIAPAKKDEEAK